MAAEDIAWDLSQLVAETDPDFILQGLEKIITTANEFRNRYYGRIQSLSAEGLALLLEEQDDFTLQVEGVLRYCYLMYAADSTTDESKKLYDAFRTTSVKVRQILAFIELEIGKVLANNAQIINDPKLGEYKHYLNRMARKVPHMLDEREEQLILSKDRNGIDAWQQLQGDWLSTRAFQIEIDGEKKEMPYGEIIGLYQHPNRDIRRRANQVVYEGLGKDDILWASALRAVCSDHLQMCEWRKYDSPMTQSLIANDVNEKAIDSLMETIEKNVELYRSYLRMKAKIMNIEKLGNWDILAPLPDAPEKKYTWKEARTEVVTAYTDFDEEIGGWVDEMFERNHIDAEVRKGKRSGAFCAGWNTGKSAYILLSFNGQLGDIFTLAHENGHAVHDYLMYRAQVPSNTQVGSSIAECGSIFGELLLTEQLLGKAKTNNEKRAVLAAVLDQFGMAAFQVSARVFFEKGLYQAIEEGKYLDGETVASLWVQGRDRIYGDAVDWFDAMRWEWTMKVHYYMPRYRFYNYPYVFAQLFVYALYRLYKEQGEDFVPKLKNLLASGSSKSPAELASELGFDIESTAFWQKGMDQAAEFIEMLEQTL